MEVIGDVILAQHGPNKDNLVVAADVHTATNNGAINNHLEEEELGRLSLLREEVSRKVVDLGKNDKIGTLVWRTFVAKLLDVTFRLLLLLAIRVIKLQQLLLSIGEKMRMWLQLRQRLQRILDM